MSSFVVIAGNIGVGKSTLTGLMAERLGWAKLLEPVSDNPYLADFYADMPRWGFHSQIFFLLRRLRQHKDGLELPGSVLQDRSIYEDAEVFARNLYRQGAMSGREWETYTELYETSAGLLRHPDLVVYLRASVPTLLRRIAQRGRDYERSLSSDYLAGLNGLYDDWVARFAISPVLTVETDRLDYVQHEDHLVQIINAVQERLAGRDILILE